MTFLPKNIYCVIVFQITCIHLKLLMEILFYGFARILQLYRGIIDVRKVVIAEMDNAMAFES